MKLLFNLFVLVMVSIPFGNAVADETDFQSWSSMMLTVPLTESRKTSLYFEVQPRVGDNWNAMERLLTRSALNYQLNKEVVLSLGGAWTPLFMNNQYTHKYRNETRIWQQASYTQLWPDIDITFLQRLRQEQRFIQGASSTAHRTRYMMKLSKPFSKGSNYGLTGYSETFLNENSVERGPRAGFDRERVFIGPYFSRGILRVELGYIGEYGKRFNQSEDRYLHGIASYISLNF
jgi:hypothetical protein